MRILLSGSSGLIGSALVESFAASGRVVVRLVRSEPKPGEGAIAWDPAAQRLDPGPLEGFDAVVHLAGESIFGLRWTAAKKERIRRSRVEGTRLLAAALARLARPPKAFVCASAIGYYGDRGDEELSEESPAGTGFLAEVCRQWEEAARPAAEAGIRTVAMRLGVVFSPAGGALRTMLRPFRLGLGGRLGSGRQYLSWISLSDVVRAVEHVLETESLSGPVNVVAPEPVTNAELTRTLARVLRRPALFPAPAFALRLVLGEMADAMLLSSVRVLPRRLVESGFRHEDPALEPALRRLLGC
jgi:uncharacterized protein